MCNQYPFYNVFHDGNERCPHDAIDIRGPYETEEEAREAAELWIYEYQTDAKWSGWVLTDDETIWVHVTRPTTK